MRSSRRPPASPRTAALVRQLEQATSVSAVRARSRHAIDTPLSAIIVCTSAAPKQSKMAPSSPSSNDNERASWGAPHARAPPGAAASGRGSAGDVRCNRELVSNLPRRLPAQPTGQVECEAQLEMVAFEKPRCAIERKEVGRC
eukprot:scaffold15304_cov72-Phaeocystis_antarctica.AAC.3